MMKDKVKKRIFYFDEVRALAILFVILCHTTTMYQPYNYTNLHLAIPGLLNMLGWVGVPLFFMISGALLLNREYALKDFFKRRFTRILYPFIFWMFITLTLQYVFLGSGYSQLFKVFFGVKRYTWFIWVMMGIYLILPVINSFIREFKMTGVKYFLAIWFFTIILQTIGKYPLFKLDLASFAGFLGYVVLGYYLANAEFKLPDKLLIIIGPILYFAFLAMNWYCQGHKIFISDSAYTSVFVVMAAVGVFIFFRCISDYSEKNTQSITAKIHNKIVNGRLGSIIISISICSYGMYFLNSLILRFVKEWHITTFKMLPVIFISTVLISWLVMVVLNKIPAIRKYIGT